MVIHTQHPQTILDSIVQFVDIVLCFDNHLNSECIEDARRLKSVVISLLKKCNLHPFLTTVGHSVSCISPDCTPSCRMFKRVRSHIQVTEPREHVCAIMHIYGQLLRMHVDTCVKDFCGMHSCKDMKKIREEQGRMVLPETFAQKEYALRCSIAAMPQEERGTPS
jgi:hypothetical protein